MCRPSGQEPVSSCVALRGERLATLSFFPTLLSSVLICGSFSTNQYATLNGVMSRSLLEQLPAPASPLEPIAGVALPPRLLGVSQEQFFN